MLITLSYLGSYTKWRISFKILEIIFSNDYFVHNLNFVTDNMYKEYLK